MELVLRWVHNPDLHFAPLEDHLEPIEHQEKEPNELLLWLVRGVGLAPRDSSLLKKGPGTADPRVALSFAGSDLREVSKHRPKTLAPVWREAFRLPVEEFQKTTEGPHLRLSCEDRDQHGAGDPMGVVDLALYHSSHSLVRSWYPLQPDPSRPELPVTGHIDVASKWVYNPDLAYGGPASEISTTETSRRRLVSTDYPRRGRGRVSAASPRRVAATRLSTKIVRPS